jgi:hypothetical protein
VSAIRYSQPVRAGGPGVQGQGGVNLGTSITLDYSSFPNPNIPVADPSQWYQDGNWDVVADKRILTGRLVDIPSDQRGPGSWVITLQAFIERITPTDVALFPAIMSSLVAKVQYGTGSISAEFEVDAWRSEFAIPATDFSISVGWSRPGTEETDTSIPNLVPTRTKVIATAYRTLETGEAVPTRSFWLNPEAGGIGVNFLRKVEVPAQAVAWCISTPAYIASTDSPLTLTRLRTISAPTGLPTAIVDSPPSDIVAAMIRGRCFREVPTFARTWEGQINSAVIANMNYALLEFKLGL